MRLVVVLVGMVMLSAPAAMADSAEPGVAIAASQTRFTSGEPVTVTATVTNQGTEPCSVTSWAEAGLRVSRLTRDGVPVAPSLVTSRYINGFSSAAEAGLITLAPGQSTTLRLAATETDKVVPGPVLATSEAAPGSGAVTALWPVGEPGQYRMSATYRSPDLQGALPACPGTQAVAEFTVGGTDPGQNWTLILVVAGAGLLVLLVAGFWLVRRRRRAGAGVLILVVALAGWALSPPGAEAAVLLPNPGPNAGAEDKAFATDLGNCLQSFQIDPAVNDPAGIMPRIVSVDTPIIIFLPTTDHSSSKSTASGATVIHWNRNDRSELEPGVPQIPCATLYHELYHAYDAGKGEASEEKCEATRIGVGKGQGPITIDEVEATLAENAYRRGHGLPQRTKYEGHPVPKSVDDCGPIKRPDKRTPVCRAVNSADCGMTNGDPHLATFDQRRFDLQSVGEFVLARSGPDWEIQTRQAPFPDSRTVSVNTAVAIRAGAHRLNFTLVDDDIEVRRNGALLTLMEGDTTLPGGVTLSRRASDVGDGYTVLWPDGSAADLDPIGSYGIRLYATVTPARAGTVTGLLGNADGDPANDLTPQGGRPLGGQPSFEQVQRVFGDSWRITQAESLFDYPPGKDTAAFSDKTFPDRPVTLADLPAEQRDRARAICTRLGVTDPGLLDDCVLDVAVTGQPAFAINSADTQQTVAPVTAPPTTGQLSDGSRVTETVPAGTTRTYTLDLGDAREFRLLDMSGDDESLRFSAHAPDGTSQYTGSTLPDAYAFRGAATGWTLRLENSGRAPATVTFRLVTVKPRYFTIRTGEKVTGTLDVPGRLDIYRYLPDTPTATAISDNTSPDCGGVTMGVSAAGDQPHVYTPWQLCWRVPMVLTPNEPSLIMIWTDQPGRADYTFTLDRT